MPRLRARVDGPNGDARFVAGINDTHQAPIVAIIDYLERIALWRRLFPSDHSPFEGMIAQGFGTEVERLHGAKSAHSSANTETQLVESKLEMVRAGWLFGHANIVHRFCCLDRADCVQRDEID